MQSSQNYITPEFYYFYKIFLSFLILKLTLDINILNHFIYEFIEFDAYNNIINNKKI